MEKILFVLKDTVGMGAITIPGNGVLTFEPTEYGAALLAPTPELQAAFANRVEPMGFKFDLIAVDLAAENKKEIVKNDKPKKSR